MQLLPADELLLDAQEKGYAVPALNVENLERIRGILEAAEEVNSPLIVQAAWEEVKYGERSLFVDMVKSIGEDKDIPVAIHLDHGGSFSEVANCVRYGFSSVMFDGSTEPFEENIKVTKKVVELAHSVGVSVEAELGTIGKTTELGEEIEDDYFTDPQAAEEFVSKTNVDFLAVAFGTAHGVYDGEPELDYERLENISALVDIPLVMHGGSGLSVEQNKDAIDLGVCKVNVSTSLRKTYIGRAKEYIDNNPDDLMTMNIFSEASEAMKERAKEVMEVMGSVGMA